LQKKTKVVQKRQSCMVRKFVLITML